MKVSTYFAKCPYEIGDKLMVGIKGNALLVNCPEEEMTTEVKITDIITVYSVKHDKLQFVFEIFDGITGKLWVIEEWKEQNVQKECDRFGHNEKQVKTNYDICCENIESLAKVIDIAKLGVDERTDYRMA